MGANDDGIWRRLVVIHFNAKITGVSDSKNYADYLFDNAGGYIMSWIIEGAQKAIAADFKTKQPKNLSQMANGEVYSDPVKQYTIMIGSWMPWRILSKRRKVRFFCVTGLSMTLRGL